MPARLLVKFLEQVGARKRNLPEGLSSSAQLAHISAEFWLQEVRRITLKDLMPNTKAVLSKLLQTLTIQEPGFKNVIILYRRTIPEKPEPKNEKTPIRDQDPVRSAAWLCI